MEGVWKRGTGWGGGGVLIEMSLNSRVNVSAERGRQNMAEPGPRSITNGSSQLTQVAAPSPVLV